MGCEGEQKMVFSHVRMLPGCEYYIATRACSTGSSDGTCE